jgi:hypothetical protein
MIMECDNCKDGEVTYTVEPSKSKCCSQYVYFCNKCKSEIGRTLEPSFSRGPGPDLEAEHKRVMEFHDKKLVNEYMLEEE